MKFRESNLSNRILVIDDNDSIHQDFCKILMKIPAVDQAFEEMESELFDSKIQSIASGGFEVDCASQGREGLALLKKAQCEERPYALAFVDGRMPPGWDGIETIRRLWEACPDLQVVLCTAYADYSWQEIRQVLGETDSLLILKKPFDNVEVLQLAHALTRKWALKREVQGRIENLDNMVLKKVAEKEHIGALLEAALEHSQAGIIIAEAKTAAICWANPAALRILEQEDLSCFENGIINNGAGWQAFGSDGSTPYSPGELPLLRATLKGEIIQNEEFLIRNAEGAEKWISSNAAPVKAPDGIISAGIFVFQDITQNKSIEAQLYQARKMESVGTMAAGIAHDFNNMLYIITGNAELAKDDTPEWNPVHAHLEEIQSVALRAAEVVKKLLNFSRKVDQNLKPIGVVGVIKDFLDLLRSTIPTSIDIQAKLPDTDVIIHGDPNQINQMMMNLCINASQAMEEMGGVLEISLEKIKLDEKKRVRCNELSPGNWLKIKINDTGPGIEPDIVECIFDPYFTTKNVGDGSGMGLAVVHGIVKNHHGGIFVDCEPGKGTSFTIFLPVVIQKKVVDETSSNEVPKGRGETLLVVDDEDSLVKMVKKMLERLGYTVEATTNPMEALEIFRVKKDAFDMVLTDMSMPHMTGLKLSEKIKAIRPDIPVIICTGHSVPMDEEAVKTSGVDAYAMKPIMMGDIARTIQSVLCKSQ